jgi:hypothetical protein
MIPCSITARISTQVENGSIAVSVISSMVGTLRPPTSELSATRDFQETFAPLVSMIIAHLNLAQFRSAIMDDLVSTIQLCLSVDPSLCKLLFLRLLDSPSEIDILVHLSKVLVPFILQLRTARPGIDLTRPPFPDFCLQVIQKFITVIGPAPPHGALTVPASVLGQLVCQNRCLQCRLLRAFLESEQKEISFLEASKIRTHVGSRVQSLRVDRVRQIGLNCETRRATSPHTLVVRFISQIPF